MLNVERSALRALLMGCQIRIGRLGGWTGRGGKDPERDRAQASGCGWWRRGFVQAVHVRGK